MGGVPVSGGTSLPGEGSDAFPALRRAGLRGSGRPGGAASAACLEPAEIRRSEVLRGRTFPFGQHRGPEGCSDLHRSTGGTMALIEFDLPANLPI